MITLDSSALFVLMDSKNSQQPALSRLVLADTGPLIVPVGILSEIIYLVETRLGHPVLEAFLEDIDQGSLQLDCGTDDLPRVRQLVKRYKDLPLGYADAAVIACAERSGGRVLTLDKHFSVVAREGKINVIPLH